MIQLTLAEREEKIKQIAGTHFCCGFDCATEYLVTIEGSTPGEQRQLFATVLSHHGLCAHKRHRGLTQNSFTSEQVEPIVKRLKDMVLGWSRTALRNNATLAETAGMLWDELTLFEGNDRVVALGILLASAVVPYACLPANLTLLKPAEMYEEAHVQILDKLALLTRLTQSDGVSNLELAAALTKILGQIESEEEKTAFLLEFIEIFVHRMEMIQRMGGAKGLMSGLILGRIISRDPEEDWGGGEESEE